MQEIEGEGSLALGRLAGLHDADPAHFEAHALTLTYLMVPEP